MSSALPLYLVERPQTWRFFARIYDKLLTEEENEAYENLDYLPKRPEFLKSRYWHATTGVEELAKRTFGLIDETIRNEAMLGSMSTAVVDGWQNARGTKLLNAGLVCPKKEKEFFVRSIKCLNEDAVSTAAEVASLIATGGGVDHIAGFVCDNPCSNRLVRAKIAALHPQLLVHGCDCHRIELWCTDLAKMFAPIVDDIHWLIMQISVRGTAHAFYQSEIELHLENNNASLLTPKLYARTRWSSLFAMFDSVFKLRDICKKLAHCKKLLEKFNQSAAKNEGRLKFVEIASNNRLHFEAAEDIAELLAPMKIAINILEATGSSLEETYMLIHAIKKSMFGKDQWLDKMKAKFVAAHNSNMKTWHELLLDLNYSDLEKMLKDGWEKRYKGGRIPSVDKNGNPCSTDIFPLLDVKHSVAYHLNILGHNDLHDEPEPGCTLGPTVNFLVERASPEWRENMIQEFCKSNEDRGVFDKNEVLSEGMVTEMKSRIRGTLIKLKNQRDVSEDTMNLIMHNTKGLKCPVQKTEQVIRNIRAGGWRTTTEEFIEGRIRSREFDNVVLASIANNVKRLNALVPHAAAVERFNSGCALIDTKRRQSMKVGMFQILSTIYMNDPMRNNAAFKKKTKKIFPSMNASTVLRDVPEDVVEWDGINNSVRIVTNRVASYESAEKESSDNSNNNDNDESYDDLVADDGDDAELFEHMHYWDDNDEPDPPVFENHTSLLAACKDIVDRNDSENNNNDGITTTNNAPANLGSLDSQNSDDADNDDDIDMDIDDGGGDGGGDGNGDIGTGDDGAPKNKDEFNKRKEKAKKKKEKEKEAADNVEIQARMFATAQRNHVARKEKEIEKAEVDAVKRKSDNRSPQKEMPNNARILGSMFKKATRNP